MLRYIEEVSKEEPKILRRTQRFLDLRGLHIFTTDVYLPCVRTGSVTMVPRQEVPNVHIFSTRAGDVIVRPDLDCYLLLPPLPTSPCADLRPLHPSLRSGEHYFSSRWCDSIYVIRGNKLLEAEDLTAGATKPARLLHASCFGGQRYFIIAGGSIGILMGPGTVTAVKDLSTGEPDPEAAPLGPRQWFKEKMGSSRSYLYWQLWDPFNGEFFSFHPKILSFLPGGLGLLKGSAFGLWALLDTIRNDSDSPVTRALDITQRVGCATETLADIGDAWTVSLSDAPKPGSVAVAIAKAQFALPVQYGGLGLNTEQEWEELFYKEKTLQFTLQSQEAAYVWQYQLGLGKETVLFCRELKVTHSSDPPSEIPLPPSS
ncbi:uncharacterized protein LOC110091392 isoform X2 [Pogona vitticeps]